LEKSTHAFKVLQANADSLKSELDAALADVADKQAAVKELKETKETVETELTELKETLSKLQSDHAVGIDALQVTKQEVSLVSHPSTNLKADVAGIIA